eukprot:1574556-Pyramimonas_sp.AAC.2
MMMWMWLGMRYADDDDDDGGDEDDKGQAMKGGPCAPRGNRTFTLHAREQSAQFVVMPPRCPDWRSDQADKQVDETAKEEKGAIRYKTEERERMGDEPKGRWKAGKAGR